MCVNKGDGMRKWRGFIVESYHYVSPRGLKEWFSFITGVPRAAFRYYLLTLMDFLRRRINRTPKR